MAASSHGNCLILIIFSLKQLDNTEVDYLKRYVDKLKECKEMLVQSLAS